MQQRPYYIYMCLYINIYSFIKGWKIEGMNYNNFWSVVCPQQLLGFIPTSFKNNTPKDALKNSYSYLYIVGPLPPTQSPAAICI